MVPIIIIGIIFHYIDRGIIHDFLKQIGDYDLTLFIFSGRFEMESAYSRRADHIPLSIPIHKRLCLFVGMSRLISRTAEAILMALSLVDSLFILNSNRLCLITL